MEAALISAKSALRAQFYLTFVCSIVIAVAAIVRLDMMTAILVILALGFGWSSAMFFVALTIHNKVESILSKLPPLDKKGEQ